MSNIFQNAKSIQEKRLILKGISKPLQEKKQSGEIESVNNGLKYIYAQSGHTVLKTIWQWNKEGLKVKKGEKALCLWGRPKEKKVIDNITGEETDPMDFFPICYVFSNIQVQ